MLRLSTTRPTGIAIVVTLLAACANLERAGSREPGSDLTTTATSSPDTEVLARLALYKEEGFYPSEDARWSRDEQRAIGIAETSFRESFRGLSVGFLIPRYKVEHTDSAMFVSVAWLELDGKQRPKLPSPVFAVSVSNDFRDVKVLPGA
jgi:hypothetical protein